MPICGLGENDDLAAIGRIGEYFLITGDGGVENDLTGTLYGRTKTDPLEDCTVFQGENCLLQPNGLLESGVPQGMRPTGGPITLFDHVWLWGSTKVGMEDHGGFSAYKYI